ncbi:ScpA family protein [Modestobacter sp. KNN46-3]|uniref:segregation and condensation protein A n=1 Tax=Modestobacter sp. KNN46-3 TaxID=2711218 RepID=UPI0013E0DD2F|nr:segregation/condensation protein A [Modestobacter sp. KNN46-3]
MTTGEVGDGRFTVRLTNFEGPFDLLLQLIGKHKLDVTEIALSTVSDEFIAHLRALGDELDLDQASEFLVVAATLLDLKAARLLPAADVEDEDDLAVLEARDLLFARLLQYRAYKRAAEFLRGREAEAARRFPRNADLEQRFADLLPEVLLGVTPEQFAAIAHEALVPKPPPTVSVSHLHAPAVSVTEQLLLVRSRIATARTATFRALSSDCAHTLEVVARFLALLELYRQQLVTFDQVAPLGELHVRWTGPELVGGRLPDEIDADTAEHLEEYG